MILRELLDYVSCLVRWARWRFLTVTGLILLTGITEGASLAVLVPMLQVIGIGGAAPSQSGLIGSLWSIMPSTLEGVIAVFLAVSATRIAIGAWRSIEVSALTLDFGNHLRNRMVEAVGGASWIAILRREAGEVPHVLIQQLNRVEGGTAAVLQLLAHTGLLIVQIVVAFMISPEFAAICLALLGMGAAVLIPAYRRIHRYGDNLGGKWRKLTAGLEGIVRTMKLVKTVRAEQRYVSALSGEIARIRQVQMGYVRLNTATTAFLNIVAAVGMGCLVVVGLRILELDAVSLLVMVVIAARIIPLFPVRPTLDPDIALHAAGIHPKQGPRARAAGRPGNATV